MICRDSVPLRLAVRCHGVDLAASSEPPVQDEQVVSGNISFDWLETNQGSPIYGIKLF